MYPSIANSTYCDLKHQLLTTVRRLEGVENGGELLGWELEASFSSANPFPRSSCGVPYLHVDDGTNNLVDLAILGGVGRGEALRDGRREGARLEGLECWPHAAERSRAGGASNAAAAGQYGAPMASAADSG